MLEGFRGGAPPPRPPPATPPGGAAGTTAALVTVGAGAYESSVPFRAEAGRLAAKVPCDAGTTPIKPL